MSPDETTPAAEGSLEQACYKALEAVVDPELGLDVVSLGLVYRLEAKGGEVQVDMTMTSPGCPVADQLLLEANNALLKVPGVEKARVNLVWSPPWTPEMMSLEAKMALGFA
ncbi:MAG: metal-sulfur cluster assembly factor [Acidobacteriota bacterium]